MRKILHQIIKKSYVLGFLIFMSACAYSSLLVKIRTDQDKNASFDQYHTFNWYQPNPALSSQSGGQTNPSLHNHLRQAIESEFRKKGMQKVSSGPQVLVAYDVSVVKPENEASRTYPAGFGYSYAYQMGYRYEYQHTNIEDYQPVNSYKPGTLIIDVIDASTNELIWRGRAEDVVSDFRADYKTVENYVDDILDKYPKKQ